MATKYSKLTNAAIRKLKPSEKLTEHGITFQRLKSGDGRYSVNIMVDGERIHRVIGKESDGTTRTQAEALIAQFRTDAKHGRLSLPKGRKTHRGFREASEHYLEKLEQENGKDLKAKRYRLKLHLVPHFGDKPLSKITAFDIERYKKARSAEKAIKSNSRGTRKTFKESGASPGTINRELAVLSQLFNKAEEWGWIDRAPAKIRRFKEATGRITYLTQEQADNLLGAAKVFPHPHIYLFIAIAIDTGMRHREVLSICKDNIDLNRRTIYVPEAKSGAREQPITERLVEVLREHLSRNSQTTSWLFPSVSAKSGHAETVRKPFQKVVESASLDPAVITPHILRHTAITHLVQAGVDLPTVKRISGHKTLAMVERYSHANGEHIKAAMDKLDHRYRGLKSK